MLNKQEYHDDTHFEMSQYIKCNLSFYFFPHTDR